MNEQQKKIMVPYEEKIDICTDCSNHPCNCGLPAGYEVDIRFAGNFAPHIKVVEVSKLIEVMQQRDGLRSAVDYASDQLTRVTEQRDAVTLRLGDTQVLMFDAEKQRDRLAEALKDALYDLETSDGLMACDNEEGHSLFCLEQRSIPKARQAIQSLNQAAVKGGNHES